jgi:hypothetical protein
LARQLPEIDNEGTKLTSDSDRATLSSTQKVCIFRTSHLWLGIESILVAAVAGLTEGK